MKFFKMFFSVFLMCGLIFGMSFKAEALEVRGHAPILNGNENTAKNEAVRNAITQAFAVTEKVSPEDLPRIMRFSILADILENRRDDYVTINKYIEDKADNGVYSVVLDVTVNSEELRETARGVREQVKNVNANPNRDKVQISIVDNVKGNYVYDDMMTYFLDGKFNLAGYAYDNSTEVTACLIKNVTDPNFGAKVRDFALENHDNEIAFFYGILNTKSVEKLKNGLYKATIHANFSAGSFEMGNIERYERDSVGVAETEAVAVGLAKVRVTSACMEAFTEQAIMDFDSILTETVD